MCRESTLGDGTPSARKSATDCWPNTSTASYTSVDAPPRIYLATPRVLSASGCLIVVAVPHFYSLYALSVHNTLRRPVPAYAAVR